MNFFEDTPCPSKDAPNTYVPKIVQKQHVNIIDVGVDVEML